MSEVTSDILDSDVHKKGPYNVFISHKVSEHGEIVKKFRNILDREKTLKDKLKIYISTGVAPGVEWASNLYNELDNADMLIYLHCYNSPPTENDWCSFETGYYARKSNRKNLITIVPKGVKPPGPLRSFQHVELTRNGVKSLLKKLYLDENIYPDLFSGDFKNTLDKIVDSILSIFSTTQKPVALSPRIWLTIKSDSVDDFKSGKIKVPLDSLITGETEAARKFGYEHEEGESITLNQLIDVVEYKGTLEPYFYVLFDTLYKIINKKSGPWGIPPVKVINNKPPNILVPAYSTKLANGDQKFEFIVTESPVNFHYPKDNFCMMQLYDIFIVSWHFRWRLLDKYLNFFKRLENVDIDKIRDNAKIEISKMKVDFKAIVLDSMNRGIQFPDDIISPFDGKDKVIMKRILDGREGLWKELNPKFEEACDKYDVTTIINCLEKMQNYNKTGLIFSLRLLEKIASKNLDGDIINGV